MTFAPASSSWNLYTAFCSGVVFPMHEGLKMHRSVAVRRRLEEQERWPVAKLEAWRLERLKEFLIDIGVHVPHYRRLFGAMGFDPHQIACLADLQQLPLTDKAAIRATGDSLKADDARHLGRYSTSGSAGDPLIFHVGKARKSHDVGAKWRCTRWWGVDIGDREVVVWGSPIELGIQDRLRQWRDRLLRSHLLPAFDMSQANLDRFVATIRSRRPAMLFGYPASLALVASHARQKGLRMDKLGIRVAFVTSEPLLAEQRAIIREVFGCPVADGYGGRDAGFIAHECPQGGMHLQAEDIIVEIVDEKGRGLPAGEAGEIVVTHTASRDFPFVRYRTGDIGVISDRWCACGRTLPILEEIQGRTTDFILTPEGRIISGNALGSTVRHLPGLERYQVIQHSRESIEVLLVTRPPFGKAEEDRLLAEYGARLGDRVAIHLTYVDHIPNGENGKYSYLVSRIPAEDRPWAKYRQQKLSEPGGN